MKLATKAGVTQNGANFTGPITGNLTGLAKVTITAVGEQQTITGTLNLTKGTKAFKGVKAKNLRVSGGGTGGKLKITAKGRITLS